MAGPGSYEPVGGWSGRFIEDAPPPAPVPITETVVAPPRRSVQPPGFLALSGSFFLAAFFIELLGLLLILYVITLFLATTATFDATGRAIFINVVWTLVSIPITRAVIHLVTAWTPKVAPLAATLLLALAARYALEAAGSPKLVALIATIPLQAGMLLVLSERQPAASASKFS